MGETIEQDVEEIKASLGSIRELLDKVSLMQNADHIMIVEHDKILVRGNGVPSLQDTVRSLVKSTNELITDFKVAQKLQLDRDASGVRACWVEQQNMTNLSNTVNNMIKNFEDERERRNKKEEDDLKAKKEEELAEKKRKREELVKWKWTGISLALTVVPPVVWQIIIFWIKLVDPALFK